MDSDSRRYIENIDFLIHSLYSTRYTRSRISWKNKNKAYKYDNLWSTAKKARKYLKRYLELLKDRELAFWKKYKEEKAKIPKAILVKELELKKKN